MELSAIIVNSIKYPLRNIAKLPIIFTLFILITIIPIGKLLDNNYIVAVGVIAFFIFLLIVPGYFLDIVKTGSRGLSIFPSLSLKDTIYDSVRVLILRAVYMIVPVAVFFLVLYVLAPASVDLLYKMQIISFLATFGLLFEVILITYLVFEFLLFFAKARMAYLDSLSEALKINKVILDIRNIGIINIIKWLIMMVVLMVVISFVSSFILAIPYVGALIDICIVIPIMESIANYSLGLLYSNIT